MDANSVEKIGGASAVSAAALDANESIVKYSDSDESFDDVNELINEEEVPF